MTDYSKCTDEDFQRILENIIDEECTPSSLLSIPGVYEAVSEEFNNAVLSKWKDENDD